MKISQKPPAISEKLLATSGDLRWVNAQKLHPWVIMNDLRHSPDIMILIQPCNICLETIEVAYNMQFSVCT